MREKASGVEPEVAVGCTTLRRTLRLDELNGQELSSSDYRLKSDET
jgi:hypothetical protein